MPGQPRATRVVFRCDENHRLVFLFESSIGRLKFFERSYGFVFGNDDRLLGGMPC